MAFYESLDSEKNSITLSMLNLISYVVIKELHIARSISHAETKV